MKISRKPAYASNMIDDDHVSNKHIMSFMCPVCHNKSVYDTEKDVYRPYEVGYDDLCVCEECGAELYARPQYDGTIQFESDVESCKTVEASYTSDTLKSKIHEQASSAMETFGFPEDEVDDYLFVEVDDDYESEYFDGPMIKVEVRAELDFNYLMDLANELNPIVEEIDPYSYFDAEDSGILVAFIDKANIESCESVDDGVMSGSNVEGAEDIGFNDWLLQEYGISSDDMTDEDYDRAYEDYQEHLKSCKSIMSDRTSDVKCSTADNRWYQGKKYHYSEVGYNGPEPVKSSMTFDDWLYRKYGVLPEDDLHYDEYNSEWDQYENYLELERAKDDSDIYSAEESDSKFDEYEDEIQEIDQEFTSENTSINSTKLPAVFKMVSFEPGTVNIDYGGGRFDNVADYLSQYDVINLVYDPYNRTPEHNKEVIRLVREHGGADTATCSNVLNVIKEPEVRMNVLNNIKKLVKSSGEIYITVYEGTGRGDEGATKSGYQLNRKTKDYLEEIQQVFPDAKRKGKLIIAHPSGSANSSVNAARKPKYWNTTFRNTVVDAYEKGELSFDNIDEWETEYNDGVKPTPSLGTKEILDYYASHPEAVIENCDSINAASSFGEDSDTYFQVYSLTDDGELEDHLEDFDDLDAAISYAKGVCEDGPCEVVEIEATDRGLQQSVCHISEDGSVTYLDEQSVLSASYGGAYDIEDDMFFTRDDINEFGYQVAALFSEECGEEFELSDVYMNDPVNLHLQVSRDGIDLSADVKIDMRRIRSPRDLDKYADPVIDQLHRAYQEDYLPYVSGSSCGNCKDNQDDYEYVSSNIAAGSSSEDYILDGSDEVMAGQYDPPSSWYDPPDYDEPYEVDPEDVEVELLLDADIELDEEGGWTYLDESYPWVDEIDLEHDSFDYPSITLDDVTGAVEKVDDLLMEKLPDTPGKYHIKGRVVLTYSISGISYTDTFLGKDEDGDPDFDREYYMDDVEIEWVRDKSQIENFEFDRIR